MKRWAKNVAMFTWLPVAVLLVAAACWAWPTHSSWVFLGVMATLFLHALGVLGAVACGWRTKFDDDTP